MKLFYCYTFCAILFVLCVEQTESLHLTPSLLQCCNNRHSHVTNTRTHKSDQIYTLREILLLSESLGPGMLKAESDPLTSGSEKFGFGTSPPFIVSDDTMKNIESQKAYGCSKSPCSAEEKTTVVCACNYNTGNVVSFKNACEMKMHNCRFDTDFKVILNEVCPWEFQSRSGSDEREFDYGDAKYYN